MTPQSMISRCLAKIHYRESNAVRRRRLKAAIKLLNKASALLEITGDASECIVSSKTVYVLRNGATAFSVIDRVAFEILDRLDDGQ